MSDKPITNAHAHCFTGDHVPPFLAKTYLPWGLHFLFPLNVFVALFRFWNNGPAKAKYSIAYKKWKQFRTSILIILNKAYPLRVILGYYIFFFSFFMVYKLIRIWFAGENSIPTIGPELYDTLNQIFLSITSKWVMITIVVIVFIMLPAIRNTLIMLLKLVWKPLTKIPGPQTIDLFERYLNIGRYAFYKQQYRVLSRLKSQYPDNTKIVILPMDMDYMAAGPAKKRYRDQMEELAEVCNMDSNQGLIYPFVFADPRRFVEVTKEKRYREGDQTYFDYEFVDGTLKLKDCFIKEYLETKDFSGIKIYPALGYYPFDEKLLPLWRYAADNQIPIMTHCIRGTIFYRGIKKQEWNQHPVFRQSMKERDRAHNDKSDIKTSQQEKSDIYEGYVPLVLPQAANVDFSYNFTHPLNYLCLLNEELLRQLIGALVEGKPNHELRTMFGYTDSKTKLTNDLSNLKICLAHFGGEDEWKRYFEKDRYPHSSQLTKFPKVGISFLKERKKDGSEGNPSPGKIEQLWRSGDWYSIICSMMLQYDNVYADISYILHGDADILPLLKETLQNEKLKTRVLYGTDFFVVRNHKSDKNMLADMRGGLSEEEFDQIAHHNPAAYLSTKKRSSPLQ